jgi:hypothetical protein
MRLARLAICLTVPVLHLVIDASPALADAPDAPDAPPAFALMDHTADGTKLDAELSVISVQGLDAAFLVPRVLGQYVGELGFGGYATTLATLALGSSDSESELGNLEVGAVYRRALTPHFDLGVRAGLALPTGGGDVTTASLLVMRPADLVLGVRNVTTFRSSISPTIHQGPFSMRVDFGIDEVIDSPGDVDPLLHLNVGVGIGNQASSVTLEYQRVFTLDEPTALQTLGLSFRGHGRRAPYVAISTPLEDELRGNAITVAIGVTLTP